MHESWQKSPEKRKDEAIERAMTPRTNEEAADHA